MSEQNDISLTGISDGNLSLEFATFEALVDMLVNLAQRAANELPDATYEQIRDAMWSVIKRRGYGLCDSAGHYAIEYRNLAADQRAE